GLLLWEAYQTAEGEIPLPPHAIVISRAHDSKGHLKQRYYALVCENPMGILHSGRGTLDTRTLRNFGNGGKPVGSSQVTAGGGRTKSTSERRAITNKTSAPLRRPHRCEITRT